MLYLSILPVFLQVTLHVTGTTPRFKCLRMEFGVGACISICGWWKLVISCCFGVRPLSPARLVNTLDTVEERNCSLITWDKLDTAANCASWFACSSTEKGNLMYRCNKPMIPPNMSGITHLKVGCDIPDLSVISVWKVPIAWKPSVVSTWRRTGTTWFL